MVIEAEEMAATGKLAALRNTAAADARYNTIVFMDDDIIFPPHWMSRLLQYSKRRDWDVLGNRVLSPDGTRYWDRATTNPHRLVSYDHPEHDKDLYQSGSFWIMRTDIFQREQWDGSISYYAQNTGGVNEDVEYSRRLINSGLSLSFDQENWVWHWDDRYTEWHNESEGARCILKTDIDVPTDFEGFTEIHKEFVKLIEKLQKSSIESF